MRTITAILLATTIIAASASAQQSSDPAAQAKTIAPFIDEGTVAIVCIDLTRVDVDALVADLAQLANRDQESAADKATMQPMIDGLTQESRRVSQWVTDISKAGGKHVYWVLTLSAPPADPFFLVFPLTPSANRQGLAKLLSDKGFEAVEPAGDCLYAGSRLHLERIQKQEPSARPRLADAFAATGDVTVRILAVPTPDVRRVADETLPGLSVDDDRISTTAVTRGLVWAAIGLEIRPAWSAKVVIQSEDAPAAAALNLAIGKLLKAFRQLATSELPVRNIDAVVALLTPTVERDHLILTLDDEQAKTLVADALLPVLHGEHMIQAGRVSKSNIRALVQACLIYCNEHNETWPEGLKTLLDEKMIDTKWLVNPRYPDGRHGYTYVKPAAKVRDTVATVLIYEVYETWGKGINVGFADGHVEFIADQTRFEKLLADTKARTDPSATRQAHSPTP